MAKPKSAIKSLLPSVTMFSGLKSNMRPLASARVHFHTRRLDIHDERSGGWEPNLEKSRQKSRLGHWRCHLTSKYCQIVSKRFREAHV